MPFLLPTSLPPPPSQAPERALLIYLAQLTQHYAARHPVLARYGAAAYRWAVSTALSRATGGDGEPSVLVPVMDLLNHGGDEACPSVPWCRPECAVGVLQYEHLRGLGRLGRRRKPVQPAGNSCSSTTTPFFSKWMA